VTATARRVGPRFLQRGKAVTVEMPLYSGGGQVYVTEAGSSYTLYDADGEAVAAHDALAVTVTEGTPKRAIASTFADDYDLPQPPTWREKWVLVVANDPESPYTIERDVIVCRVAPVQVIDDEDLYALHPEWRRIKAEGQTSHADARDEAWNQLVTALLTDGVLPNQVLNAWALRSAHLYLTLHLRCLGFGANEAGRGKWTELADRYEKKFEKAYAKIALRKDGDEDGVADDPSKLTPAEPELFLTDVPAWSREGNGGGYF
jgi:hypothetical protein